MSNSPSSKALLILAFTGVLGVGALAYYVKTEPGAAHVPPALRQQTTLSDSPLVEIKPHRIDSSTKDEEGEEVSLPKIEGNDAHLEEASTQVPDGLSPMKFVAENCLKEANVEGVKVLGIDVVNSTAVINFDDNIDSGMGGNQEGTFLKALQVAFGQFPNIKKIELQKNNEPLTSLGEIEISGPLEVIRGGNSANAPSSKQVEP